MYYMVCIIWQGFFFEKNPKGYPIGLFLVNTKMDFESLKCASNLSLMVCWRENFIVYVWFILQKVMIHDLYYRKSNSKNNVKESWKILKIKGSHALWFLATLLRYYCYDLRYSAVFFCLFYRILHYFLF